VPQKGGGEIWAKKWDDRSSEGGGVGWLRKEAGGTIWGMYEVAACTRRGEGFKCGSRFLRRGDGGDLETLRGNKQKGVEPVNSQSERRREGPHLEYGWINQQQQ